MQPQRVGERKTENRRQYVRFSGETDGWGVAAKGQRDGEEEKAAEGVGENGGYKERALQGFAVAKAHNKGVVKAATAAIEHESADNRPNSNVSKINVIKTNIQVPQEISDGIECKCTYTLNVIEKMNNMFNMMREISKIIRNNLRRLHQFVRTITARRASDYLDWSATAPTRGENIMPSVVPIARMRDQAAGEGIDQPNCTIEFLNNSGVREWNATLIKPLHMRCKYQQKLAEDAALAGPWRRTIG